MRLQNVCRVLSRAVCFVFALIAPELAVAAIGFVQVNATTSSSALSSVTTVYANAAQTAGNLNVVVIGWEDSTSNVSSVTDSRGNSYALAGSTARSAGNASVAIYYAKNIVAAASGANTVTVTFSAAVAYPDVRIAEYSGIDTAAPLDVAKGNAGSGTVNDTGTATTTNANDLIVAGNMLYWSTNSAGTGFTSRVITDHSHILEDRVVTSAGNYSATVNSSGGWYVIQMAAFKAAAAGDTLAPSAPTGLTAIAASSSQINLSWTASTDNVGVTGYRVERCQGAGCTSFAQVAIPTGTSYSDTALSSSTVYRYRVSARDALPNWSVPSDVKSATTNSDVPVSGTTKYEYDDAGRLRIVTHPNFQTSQYTLDAGGNRKTVAYTPPPVLFQLSAASATEGSPLTFTVTRLPGSEDDVTVRCAPSSVEAMLASDFTAPSATLIFTAAESNVSKTCQIPTIDDAVYEGPEKFSLNLIATAGYARVPAGPAQGTILDNENPPSFSVTGTTVSEAFGNAGLTIALSGLSAFNHAVTATTADGSAVSPSDYIAKTQSIVVPAGQLSATFTVSLANDAVYEGNESFSVHLSAPTLAATLGAASATVNITEDDPPPSFSISDASSGEKGACYPPEPGFPDTAYCDPGYQQFVVTKSGSTTLSHTITITPANGTAVAGSDFISEPVTYTFAPGATTYTFLVNMIVDSVYEGTESFTVNLTNPTNGATIGDGSGTGTILESSLPVPGKLQFSSATATVNENGGPALVAVSRINGADLAASVLCTTSSGSASAGADFTSVSQTLTWVSGDNATKYCTVPILDDSAYEGNETFLVTLSAVSGATLGTQTSATVTIIENDSVPPPGTLQFSSSAYSGSEGSSVTVSVTRVGGSSGAVSVSYATSNGSAAAGSDYTGVSGTLSWTNGDTSTKSFSVPLLDDFVYESTQTLNVVLSGVSGTTYGNPVAAVVSITDTDNAPIFQVGYTSGGNEGTTLQFIVTKTWASELTHQVSYSTSDGSAVAGVDYGAISGSLTFGPLETQKTLTVSALTDSAAEATETFTVSLSNPTNGAGLGSASSATGSIYDVAPSAPPTPTNLHFQDVNPPYRYNVVWNSAAGAAYYELEEIGSDYNTGTNSGPTSYTLTDLSKQFLHGPNTWWRYRVRACNASNICSGWSNPVSVLIAPL